MHTLKEIKVISAVLQKVCSNHIKQGRESKESRSSLHPSPLSTSPAPCEVWQTAHKTPPFVNNQFALSSAQLPRPPPRVIMAIYLAVDMARKKGLRRSSCEVCVCASVCVPVCVHVCTYIWMCLCVCVCVLHVSRPNTRNLSIWFLDTPWQTFSSIWQCARHEASKETITQSSQDQGLAACVCV